MPGERPLGATETLPTTTVAIPGLLGLHLGDRTCYSGKQPKLGTIKTQSLELGAFMTQVVSMTGEGSFPSGRWALRPGRGSILPNQEAEREEMCPEGQWTLAGGGIRAGMCVNSFSTVRVTLSKTR